MFEETEQIVKNSVRPYWKQIARASDSLEYDLVCNNNTRIKVHGRLDYDNYTCIVGHNKVFIRGNDSVLIPINTRLCGAGLNTFPDYGAKYYYEKEAIPPEYDRLLATIGVSRIRADRVRQHAFRTFMLVESCLFINTQVACIGKLRPVDPNNTSYALSAVSVTCDCNRRISSVVGIVCGNGVVCSVGRLCGAGGWSGAVCFCCTHREAPLFLGTWVVSSLCVSQGMVCG